MEKMSSGILSDVLQLPSVNFVIHGGSWKQHIGYLQLSITGECWCFALLSEECGSQADGGLVPEWTSEPELSEWAM